MKLQSTRLFINNLQDNIHDEDLRNKFSRYGTITTIEIKERKNPVGNQTSHFAYITLEIENKALQECMREFSSTKWKGFYVDVQVARESFMDRLKREREESAAQLTSNSVNNGIVGSSDVIVNRNYRIEPSYEKVKPAIHIKHNENSVSIPEANDTIENGTANQSTKRKNDAIDNAKRLQSLRQMKEGYRQQKQFIKNSLSNIEGKKSNKIVFDDAVSDDTLKIQKSTPKLTLFEGGEEGDEDMYNFEVREELQGQKGQKLMQLQSRFKNDKRFKMDSRFLEEDTEEVNEVDMCEEKEKQMEILESVLGQKIKRWSNPKDAHTSIQPNVMLRFDPSQPEHSKYEVQPRKVETKKQKVKKVVVTREVAPQPEVSKETFYTVESDLKQSLYSSEGFSLSKLFGTKVNEIEEETAQEHFKEQPRDVIQTEFGPNPFKYDSSEDEKEEPLASLPFVEKIEKVQVKPRLWTDTFFFKEDDYRLQEGFDFIKRLQVAKQQNFNTVRRNLREIVKGKVKNNLRKNRPFKRKLGGANKKRIQIKKVLKR
ncbi:hypothetical protein PPYR_00817 [Photinus pyralis]|uniref:RRM domain-containing protein n=2 Tax=Photinus pyralis TaxID=7054 RepID=A0A1Y1M410_PHOPY|nr:hypothetical protein PPYR_00817 [Photinus pyralis]